MLVGLAVYLFGRRHLPPDRLVRGVRPPPLSRAQWIVVAALIGTFLPRILFNAAAQQAYGIMLIWADKAVDRNVGGFEMPVTWINTIDGVLTIVGVLVAARIWAWQLRRGREPDDLMKVIVANLMVVGAFAFIGVMAGLPKVPLAAWVLFFIVLDFSFAWFDPPLKALIARYAPASVNGTMFALSNAASALGFFTLGWLGRFYEPLGAARYFLFTASLPLVTAALLFAARRPLLRLLEAGEYARDDIGPGSVALPAG